MWRRSSSWLGLGLLLTIASVLALTAAAPAAGPLVVMVADPEEAAATIERLTGFAAPPGSCLADPATDGCPAVTKVVITLPAENDAGSTDYVPLDGQDTSAGTASAEST